MKRAVFLLMLFTFLWLVITLVGCAVYPSPGCKNDEIMTTKAMAARALMLQMEVREPINWHCVPCPIPPQRQQQQAQHSATSYVAPPPVVQNAGDYTVDISTDGKNLLIAVDARLIRQPGPGEGIYFVDSSTAWRPVQGREMAYNPDIKCWEASFPTPPSGDYQGNATIQVAGTELKTADSFWAAVHKSNSKWVKINPSTQKGSINFRICDNGNVEPGPGI
ncbi:MAG: hypothetical protein CEO40_95 [Parcubacteria group bacterium LiPW_72]|nr:MAG: hypothetical protein CEO40_95 [Parcubacteria group bacterium LiPW_72]